MSPWWSGLGAALASRYAPPRPRHPRPAVLGRGLALVLVLAAAATCLHGVRLTSANIQGIRISAHTPGDCIRQEDTYQVVTCDYVDPEACSRILDTVPRTHVQPAALFVLSDLSVDPAAAAVSLRTRLAAAGHTLVGTAWLFVLPSAPSHPNISAAKWVSAFISAYASALSQRGIRNAQFGIYGSREQITSAFGQDTNVYLACGACLLYWVPTDQVGTFIPDVQFHQYSPIAGFPQSALAVIAQHTRICEDGSVAVIAARDTHSTPFDLAAGPPQPKLSVRAHFQSPAAFFALAFALALSAVL